MMYIYIEFTIYFLGISEMKMQYDESDNILIRSSRFFTDKITNIAGIVIFI